MVWCARDSQLDVLVRSNNVIFIYGRKPQKEMHQTDSQADRHGDVKTDGQTNRKKGRQTGTQT